MPWKKIASLFAVSLSLGVLGASCTAKDEEQRATSDAVETADDGEALEAADSPAPRDRFDRDRERHEFERREYDRCVHFCDERYHRCIRDLGHDRDHGLERRVRCDRTLNECRRDCRARHRF